MDARNQSEIADAQYIAKNKFVPTDQRNAAFEQWRTALENQQNNIRVLQNDLIDYAAKAIEAKSVQGVKVTLEDMLKVFEIDLQPENRNTARETASRVYGYH